MNKVVNERRGAIFDEEDSVMQNAAANDASGRSMKKGTTNSLFGARNSSNRK